MLSLVLGELLNHGGYSNHLFICYCNPGRVKKGKERREREMEGEKSGGRRECEVGKRETMRKRKRMPHLPATLS